jgi:hypothetical protein
MSHADSAIKAEVTLRLSSELIATVDRIRANWRDADGMAATDHKSSHRDRDTRRGD